MRDFDELYLRLPACACCYRRKIRSRRFEWERRIMVASQIPRAISFRRQRSKVSHARGLREDDRREDQFQIKHKMDGRRLGGS
jgi:hypothetical protein